MSDSIRWLGHATVLVELGGTRLLTDPVLRPRVAHLRRHVPTPPAPGALAAILISHLHRDHLDVPTVRGLDPRAELIVPPGGARVLRASERTITELAPGERRMVGSVEVTAVPADHDGRRSPLSSDGEAVGYVLRDRQRIYFAGDTEPFAEMAELRPLDVALLPIWGWGPSLGPGHMDPDEAAEAAALLRPTVAVPIHWGTYLRLGMGRRHAHVLRDPPLRFADRVAELAPATRVEVLAPGGAMALPVAPESPERPSE